MQLPDKVVEGVEGFVAGLFGLAGTLITAVISWLRDRGVTAHRIHQVEEATRRLQFWDQWVKVAAQLPHPIDQVAVDKVQQEMILLARILQASSRSMETEFAAARTESTALHDKVNRLPFWRQWLLLYNPPRTLAWLPRLFFYVGLMLCGIILFALADPTKTMSVKEIMIVEAFFISGTMVFRYLSQSLEKPHAGHGTPPPPLPGTL